MYNFPLKTRIPLIASVFSLFVVAGNGQPFGNLGFESAFITNSTPTLMSFSTAFPSWQGRFGGVLIGGAWYNSLPLDATALGIYAGDTNHAWFWPPIFGKYSAVLQACPIFPPSTDAELAQTGLIPSDAKSVRFATAPIHLSAPGTWEFSFRINGQSLPYFGVDTQTNYNLWAADISAYAGTVVEIAFRLQSEVLPGHPATEVQPAIGLDGISFSAVPIPEPGSAVLLTLGTAALLWRRWKAGRT